MDFIPKDRILEFKPDTLEIIRKQYNLDKPGQMKEAIDILQDWVQKQKHFKKKDFSEHYYEVTIIGCKGSIERAKNQIDRICTLRTLLPQFFGNYNVKTDFDDLNEIAFICRLPKLTDDYYRVDIIKLRGNAFKPSQIINYYRSNIIFAEYLKAHDYMNGFILIVDFTEASLMEYAKTLNLVLLKQARSILSEGFGMRIKAIHIITPSKIMETMVSLLKQVVSPKVASRINIYETVEDVHKHIPKSILPKDYGGEERSFKELEAEWIEALSSEEHLKYMQEMNEAGTDETFRDKNDFDEQCTSVAGTFRQLSVD